VVRAGSALLDQKMLASTCSTRCQAAFRAFRGRLLEHDAAERLLIRILNTAHD